MGECSPSEVEELLSIKRYTTTDSTHSQQSTHYGSTPSINSNTPSSVAENTGRINACSINSNVPTCRVTVDEILDFTGFGPFQFLACILAAVTYFSYSCSNAVFIFTCYSVQTHWNLTIPEYTILPATCGVTNVLGALVFSLLTDRFGRLWPYALCLAWIGAFDIASAFANSFLVFVIIRCINGLGFGGVAALTYTMIIEFLPIKNRGKVAILNTLVGVLGLCTSCGLAWWLIPMYPVNGWRYYILAIGIPPLLAAVLRLIFHFESPRYLVARRKLDKAWSSFNLIAKINGKDLSSLVNREDFKLYLDPLNHSISPDTEPPVAKPRSKKQTIIFFKFLQIFRLKYLRITLPLCVLILTEDFGYYSSQLFLFDFLIDVGSSTYFTILVASIAQIPGYLLMSIIMEWPKVGRLNSLRFFSTLCVIFFLLLTFFQTPVSIPVLLILIYFSAAPILGLLYTYISESYPTDIRAVSVSFFYILQALGFIAGAFLSGYVENRTHHWLFPAVWAGIYGAQLCAGLVLNYEPQGRKLRDITE